MNFNDFSGIIYVLFGMGGAELYIDKKYYKTCTVHRNIVALNTSPNESILSCGFVVKNKNFGNHKDCIFNYYGGFYVISGIGTYVDSNGDEYKLYPGCFVQRIPGRVHSSYVDEDCNWLEVFVCFGKTVFEKMAELGIFNNTTPVLYIGESQRLLSELINYMEDLKNAQNDDLPFMLLEAQKILYNINLMYLSNNNIDFQAKISLSCKRIREDIREKINMKKIASEIGLGYESFRKQFKITIGISPTKYLITERINMAKIMLLDEDISIKKVAATLQYFDEFAFIKQFKKYAGMTPGEFIKMHSK